jgi:hypothetical protein
LTSTGHAQPGRGGLRSSHFPFERDLAEVPPRFRVGLFAAMRAGFLAPAALLMVFRFVVFVDGFFAADAFFDAFFFGDFDAFFFGDFDAFFFGDAVASFAFRFAAVFRFLAAPIAAPESAPITVPTTGTPKAVPATAPATAPPRALPEVPVVVSD